jgi:FkbH-like protein
MSFSIPRELKDILSRASSDNAASIMAAVHEIEQSGIPLDVTANVVVLRNFTAEALEPFVRYHAYAAGLRPSIVFGGYDLATQDLMDEAGPVRTARPDLVVLALVIENLDPSYQMPGWASDTVIERLSALFDLARKSTSAMIAVNTLIPPSYSELGLAPPSGRDVISEVMKVNSFVKAFVAENASRFCLVDWERYLRILGEEQSLDHRYWYLAKAPFRTRFLDLYASEIVRVLRVLKGKAKKCLILDCDNTLWGGVVGEDGLDGIALDAHDYPGRAFFDFQCAVLHLAERGILVALCSKNNEADVMEVLERHPACLIKPAHLAAWRIDWNDKATNVIALAEELNLGLDSFVFVDDNPLECEQLRRFLPDLTVLKVPSTLFTYPTLLLRDGLFDTLKVSAEDQRRATLYQSEARRKKARASYRDVDEYLATLGMVATIHRAAHGELGRVAQLTQKTNQFNVTTRRYTEGEIERLAAGPNSAVYTLSANDRFGDMGLVGVLIATMTEDIGTIDTLLMSCRVLGRRLETTFVGHCLKVLEKAWGVRTWQAEYIPTRKNQMAASFWNTTGFAEVSSHEGRTQYALKAGNADRLLSDFIEIRE